MSVLRRALGRPHEERASTLSLLPRPPAQLVPDIPDGYGMPGYGSWGQGMVWNSWPSAVASSVTTDSALRLSAVFGCQRILSEGISTLPADTFIRKSGVRLPYRPRPVYLEFQPPQASRIIYLSQVMMSLLNDGNAFVYTPRDKLGVPIDLVPLQPDLVSVCREGGRIHYEVAGSDREWTPLEIMHIPYMMLPGALRGLSPLQCAREVIDGGRKAQEFGTNVAANHAVPPAVLEIPSMGAGDPKVEQDRARKIAETWHATHGGTDKAGKVGVLLGGAKLTTIAVSPEDMQWIDSKRFGVSEIARFYGVPPHLIADASNSTSWGSGLSEQNLAFGQFSLRPWIERIEDAHNRLLTTHGLPDVFVKLNLDALLRASLKDRYDSYAVGINNRFLLPNEARRLEDLAPLVGGDQFPADTATPAPEPAPGGAP